MKEYIIEFGHVINGIRKSCNHEKFTRCDNACKRFKDIVVNSRDMEYLTLFKVEDDAISIMYTKGRKC